MEEQRMTTTKKYVFALAGNPNCGKTTLFNSLTGATAYVGNWPGVTVEKRAGTYSKKDIGTCDIVDLPGIYSLSPYTPEEVVSRNFILDEHPDCVIDVVDATNLERNMYLTTQILEMDVPVITALNMMDALRANGQDVDCEKLSKRLHVPVVPVSALKFENLDNLMKEAIKTCTIKRQGYSVLLEGKNREVIEQAKAVYVKDWVPNPLYHAIKDLEADDIERQHHPFEFKQVSVLVADNNDFEQQSSDERYHFIDTQLGTCIVGIPKSDPNGQTLTDKVDRVLTSRIWGIPIFILVLLLIFHLTFSEDLLFLNAMGAFGKDGLVTFPGSPFEGLFANGGIASPGVFLSNFINDLTGLFTEWLRDLITVDWVEGLICDGICAGVFAVFGFLPQILVLFTFFSILEDSGYMARVAFILDRIFRKFGLSGRSFIPMILGFGCSVPAMMNTRTLSTEKERTQTIRVIPFFPCSAKLTMITAVGGALALSFGVSNVDLIASLVYVLAMVIAIVSVISMHVTTQREELPPFIMELPNYHRPQIHSLSLHVWDKAKGFIKKAFTVILMSTLLVWLFSHITWKWQFLSSDTELSDSILASLGMFIQPLFTPLGFGYQISKETGWVFVVSSFMSLIAKENAISTFATFAASLGFSEVASSTEAVGYMIQATGINMGGLLAFIVFNVLTIPCIAAVATAKAELPKGQLKYTVLFWLAVSYGFGSITYLVFTWTWTLAIFIPAFALFFVFLYMYNRKKSLKEQNKEAKRI